MNKLLVLALFASTSVLASPLQLRLDGITGADGAPVTQALEKQPLVFHLALVDTATGKALTPADLQVEHEKLFHLFAFDQALVNYVHEHPVASNDDAAEWDVTLTFPQTGIYHLWADVTPKGGTEATAETIVQVGGTTPANAPITSLEPVLSGEDRGSVLTLSGADDLTAGGMAILGMAFTHADGTPPALTNYLGAIAHVTITNLDGSTMIHAHPMLMSGMPMLHTEFPASGDYRLFVQFMDGGVLRTVLLAVRVR
jgi:hypothetical protein